MLLNVHGCRVCWEAEKYCKNNRQFILDVDDDDDEDEDADKPRSVTTPQLLSEEEIR